MSRLSIFEHDKGDAPVATFTGLADIARELGQVGVRFEQWEASQPVAPGASQDEVIAAYRADIDRLMQEEGYKTVDVVSLTPDHPDRAAFRQKFLSEHTHAEDEVRFFVAGAGQFTLHIGERVYDILCEKGDLIGVPDGTRHWFDMSESPYFVAIRLFNNPAGWVAEFTGDDIAQRFPRMTPHASAQSAGTKAAA
ncbi:1,2-dihydroxy-3-keto-5-methylthiopentene dioxygenase [Dokdonella sp. MW10]|uniref:1,2-dihydroxy-3-keto-5-methylthiopentene dioxygenase n=1 Tax=Dokdonella sp. MW10 TaxID=2992926 RepID=UPI003F80D19B